MTQTRSLLLIAWLFLAGWLWLQWNQFNAAPAAANGAVAPATTATPTPGAAPALPAPAAALPGEAALPAVELPGGSTPTVARADAPVVRLRNDVLELALDAHGNVVDSHLLGYQQEKRAGSPDVQLLSIANDRRYVARAGLIQSPDGVQQNELPIDLRPVAGRSDFRIADGAPALRVPLQWTDPATGVRLQRTLVLTRGSYLLSMEDEIANTGASAQRVYPYVELARTAPPTPGKLHGFTNPEAFSFVGAAWYTPEERFAKTPFTEYDDETPPAQLVTGGWIGMLQHHFVTAWVPGATEQQKFSLLQDNADGVPMFRIRSNALPVDLAPGAKVTRKSQLWVGPKLQKQLGAIAPGLKLALDYGMFTFIAQPLFDYVLKPLHDYVTGNWGWAIILTVLLLKLALYPLSAKQFKSMAKMRALAPRMEALKERYGSGQEYQVAMMELYKKEKVNPVSGCLPILIPLPIFFALYWVLLETVELRHAPWAGWIQNLTAPDPYFVLPVLNLAVMYLTQKMTPTPGMDPMQKKMMQFMPLIFGVLMAFFPAGLVLYWVTNGSLGLLQQWWMYRQQDGGPGAKPAVAR